MDRIDKGILLGAVQFLVYAGFLVFFLLKCKAGAPWTKKLSVRVTGVFAGLRALGGLATAALSVAWKADLPGRTEEAYETLLYYPETLVGAVTTVYLAAMLLLALIYLGKVPSGKKK